MCKTSGHAFDKVNQEPLNDVQGKTTFALNDSDIRVKLARGKSSCRGASHLKSNSFKPSVCTLNKMYIIHLCQMLLLVAFHFSIARVIRD